MQSVKLTQPVIWGLRLAVAVPMIAVEDPVRLAIGVIILALQIPIQAVLPQILAGNRQRPAVRPALWYVVRPKPA